MEHLRVNTQFSLNRALNLIFDFWCVDYADWGTVPYDSKESLVIIRPNKGITLDQLINEKLTNTDIYSVCELAHKDWTTAELTIQLPKFKIISNTNLVEPLKKVIF